MSDNDKYKKAQRAFRSSVPRIYVLMYTIVALPMVYYGLIYIKMIANNPLHFILATGVVMALSFSAAMFVQIVVMKDINAVFSGVKLDENRLYKAKIKASVYPIYIMIITTTGWVILLNAIALLPIYLKSSGSVFELLIGNILAFSGALSSIPIVFFITEGAVSGFLALPDVSKIDIKSHIFKPTFSFKIIMVCLVIIISLCLNFSVAIMINIIDDLSTREMATNVLVAGFTGIVSAILVSSLFARSLKQQVTNIKDTINHTSDGDLTRILPRLSNDELGDISEMINNFLLRLSGIISNIKHNTGQNIQNVEKLQDAMNNTGVSIDDINKTADEVKKEILMQASVVKQVYTIILEISKIIKKQDQKIHDQVSSVAESSAAIQEMIANINSIAKNLQANSGEFSILETSMNFGNEKLAHLKDRIMQLDIQSDTVMEANTVIKQIASQTNLLAMNAAIESAHAGQYGKGFAVVANEIRKLAEVSDQQSKLISKSLKDLKSLMSEAVSISNETGDSFSKILQSVNLVNSIEGEIRNAINEQASSSTQILQALTVINTVTTEVNDGSSDIIQKTELIIPEINNLNAVSDSVNNAAAAVVENALTIRQNADESLKFLELNKESIKKINELIEYFITRKIE